MWPCVILLAACGGPLLTFWKFRPISLASMSISTSAADSTWRGAAVAEILICSPEEIFPESNST